MLIILKPNFDEWKIVYCFTYFWSAVHCIDVPREEFHSEFYCHEAKQRQLGLGRAPFFMVRVGFRACSFSPGWARATGNLHGLISGRNILNSGCIRAAFGPHSGHIWATIIYE